MMVTLVTAGCCGLLYFVLSFRVVQMRLAHRINLGDGGNDPLLSRIRAHANFAEYVPIILILMGLIEMRTGVTEMLTSTGVLLFLLRIIHAIGMARPAPNPFRVTGAAGTWIILIGLSVWAIILAYTHHAYALPPAV
jgi:uncharacterized membrane protein YecN with MAPEG domain